MSTELATIEGTRTRSGGELAPVAPVAPATLFGTDDPDAVVERASKAAKSLAKVVKDQGLTNKISGKDYVRVEGWTLLGSMLGVFPRVTEMHKLATDGGGWEAYVEARTRGGEIVGGAWAQCTRSEKLWSNRDDYALRSMAQTRATAKALRMPLGFVMALAGFDATPAEEMPAEGQQAGIFTAPTDTAKATKQQVEKINTLLDKRAANSDTSRDVVDDWLRTTYGTAEIEKLTKGQATELIERIS